MVHEDTDITLLFPGEDPPSNEFKVHLIGVLWPPYWYTRSREGSVLEHERSKLFDEWLKEDYSQIFLH